MKVKLEISTKAADELVREITAELAAAGGDIGDGVSLAYRGTEDGVRAGGIDVASLVVLAVGFPVGVATNVVSEKVSRFLRGRSGAVEGARLVITEEVEVIEDGSRRTVKRTRYESVPE